MAQLALVRETTFVQRVEEGKPLVLNGREITSPAEVFWRSNINLDGDMWELLPLEIIEPQFSSDTHIENGQTITVLPGEKVVIQYLVRPLTPAELAEREQAELDADAMYGEEVVSKFDQGITRVLLRVIFEIAKAARTGNWSVFTTRAGDPVTDYPTFLDFVKKVALLVGRRSS